MKEDAYSLWLAGGSMLLVDARVPTEQRQAVLDCVLYAQLLADKKSGLRFERYQHWYAEYRDALSKRGWIINNVFHDSKPAADCALLVPAQPLQLWLADCQSAAEDAVANALAALQQNTEASCAFSDFVRLRDDSETHLALEIGLVLPGPVIHLSSVSVTVTNGAADEPILFDSPLRAVLEGEVMVKGTSAFLDWALFEPHASDLRALIEKKQGERAYLRDLGALAQGVDHE